MGPAHLDILFTTKTFSFDSGFGRSAKTWALENCVGFEIVIKLMEQAL